MGGLSGTRDRSIRFRDAVEPKRPLNDAFDPTRWRRRGRDLNPRRTQEPETVFETAAFDRSATPPKDAQGTRRQETVMFSFMPAASWPGTVQ
jgi:hypothetical protein